MTLTTLSSRQFNQDIMSAKRAARDGPVVITVRGHPEHVLLSMDDYKKLTQKKRSILEAIATHTSEYVEFEPSGLEFEVSAANFK